MKSKWAIFLFMLVLAKAAIATCPNPVPPNVACVKWEASPSWTDNKPYAAGTVLTYRVWILQPSGKEDHVVAVTTGLDATIKKLPLGQQCFIVLVTASPVPSGYEPTSSPSGVSCKTLRFPGPTNGSIEAPTDGSIEKPK